MLLGLVSILLGGYVWRQRGTAALLRAQVQQRAELQKRLMEGLPTDQCLYPHSRSEVGYVLNPFMTTGTLWGLKDHPYAINSWGLRGGEIARKAPGRKRIVLVGDSWFFGWQLGDEDRLENHMRSALKDGAVEIVTVALPGWNVRSEAAFLESHIAAVDPDAIVWEICPNDMWEIGGVIPPGALSWAFSPQNRNPDRNAVTTMQDPLPLMPFVLDRQRENVSRMDEMRTRYGIPVLAAPVDIPPAAWSTVAGARAAGLPTRFIPQVYASDRTGWIAEHDSHPNRLMNERMALGYLAKLAEMGIVRPLTFDADQQAVVGEWDRANSRSAAPDEVAAYLQSVMDHVPEAYAGVEGFRRVAAGIDEDGRMGRHGVLYLRTASAQTAVHLELDVEGYAPRYGREVKVAARTFEREETTATATYSAAAQRVTCRVPIPAAKSRYPVLEVEWLFNSDECADPTGCTAARLVRAYSR